MHTTVHANTTRGPRRFAVTGDSGPSAEAMLRSLIEQGERLMDENGQWFESREIEVQSLRPGEAAPAPGSGTLFSTDGGAIESE